MGQVVYTAEGAIAPAELGVTQAHEHFFSDISFLTAPSTDPAELHYYEEAVGTDNYAWVHSHATCNRSNGILTEEQLAITDYSPLKELGVEAVVDCSPRWAAFNPTAVRHVARQLGLKVVLGTGYYTVGSVEDSQVPASPEAVAEELLRDLLEGFPEADFRAGFIGEIGTSFPLAGFEQRVLHGACLAQQQTDACLFIHPGYSPEAPKFVSDFAERHGADPTRVVLCHSDSRLQEDLEMVCQLAKRGFYIAYDTFGRQRYNPLSPRQHPNDAQRIKWLRQIADAGFLDRIHISTDVCWRTELACYGGYGRKHLFENILPAMREAGFAEQEIQTIVVDNPARALARPESS